MSVLGKMGECKKCKATFRAPTAALIKRRRIIQIVSSLILGWIFIGIPALYVKASMEANKRAEIARRELPKLEGSLRLQDLLDAESFSTIQDRLVQLDPPEDKTDLVSRITSINSKLKNSGNKQVAATAEQIQAAAEAAALAAAPKVDWDPSREGVAGNNKGRDEFLTMRQKQDAARAAAFAASQGLAVPDPPKDLVKDEPKKEAPASDAAANEDKEVVETGLVSREAAVFGDAYDFLVDGLGPTGDDKTFFFLTGEDYVEFISDYDSLSKKEYVAASKLAVFREKDEFETSADYEQAKETWQSELREPTEIVQENLKTKAPPRTFVVDDLSVLDAGRGYDADHQCWKQLQCVFTEDDEPRVSDFTRAVSDDTVKEGDDIHRGERDFDEAGPEWKILSQDEYLNLPIEVEKAKDLRKKLDANWVRVGLVIQFPGESRFSNPTTKKPKKSEPKLEAKKGDEKNVDGGGSPSVDSELEEQEKKQDNRFAVILRKIVIYNKETGEIYFDRTLSKPNWDNVELLPLKENLSKLGL